jgi:RNA recognition motif-containing protein
MKLYVGNLSFNTMEDDLQQLFSQVGSIESVSMVTDRDTGRSRGFAFVEMSSKSEGEAAIAKFNGTELDGRSLTVNEAKPRENRGASGGGFGGGRNGGGFGRGRGSGRSRY